PAQVLPFYSQVFMAKMVVFVQLYFPVFLLGAIFGKLIEMSGAAASLSAAIVRRLGERHVMLSVVLTCAVLTYGGVSLFVVVFAAYPLAAVMFRQADIPKRLIPGTIALGSFTFTMDALPGTPQIQNVIPTAFFGTNLYAAPILGCAGAIFILTFGMAYLQWQRHRARDGYGVGHINEPPALETAERRLHPLLALLPLALLTATNFGMVRWIAARYGKTFDFASLGLDELGKIEISKTSGIWAIETALCVGIITTLVIGAARIRGKVSQGMQSAVSGSLLAAINTASEYGFGGVIACLPGFVAVKNILATRFAYPLVNEAVSINILAGITGSASGGLSLALAVMGKQYQAAAASAGIDPQVLHRVASMASGGMDTLPHNGAVITLLLITGLTHRQSYKDIFAITCLKTAAVFFVIAVFRMTGLY
ncbi:MAG TPA: GntP family permease, partial [Humisphaera sp.]|nr:GntP family permease [Humisphaera sp.]